MQFSTKTIFVIDYTTTSPQWRFSSVHKVVIVESMQRAKKRVVPNSPWLVDFAIGLLNPVLNLSKVQVKVPGKFKLQNN